MSAPSLMAIFDDQINRRLDAIDYKIILMATQGCTSSYAVWTAMQREFEQKSDPDATKVLAYKNIHQRALNLLRDGFLEEIKVNSMINMHGRRDYKVTWKGFRQLYFHLIVYPQDLKGILEYMDKINFNKQLFTNTLVDLTGSVARLLSLHTKLTGESIELEWKNGQYTAIKHGTKSKLKKH
jgi:hypothetical protein